MKLRYPHHGLRVTVRLHGTVVSQRVLWAPPSGALLTGALLAGGAALGFRALAVNDLWLFGLWGPLLSQLAVLLLAPTGMVLAALALAWPRETVLGVEGGDAVPTLDGMPLATLRWRRGAPPELVDHADDDAVVPLAHDGRWSWSQGDVQVDVDAQERAYARRMPDDPLGDLSLVVVALTMWVAVFQANLFFLQPAAGGGSEADSRYEMSPELIARLLERDLEGEDQGVQAPVDRPDHERQGPGVYLPAGNEGALSRAGGGEQAGDEVIRTPPPEEEDELLPAAEQPAEDGEEALALEQSDEPAELEAPPAPAAEEALPQEPAPQVASRPRDPMERFIGWGFRDWYESAAAEEKLDPRVERQLHLARTRLALDPDDIGALQVVGHYAYLAENVELCQDAYQRIIELYPDTPGAYNNLALTYKRQGRFAEEEALYRKALELEPFDPIVMNNLAVSLAHQGRFDEALDLMAIVEEITPDDPYSALHMAKIYAGMGKRAKAYRYLERALEGIDELETLHHIEFRQDLRLEPLFDDLRDDGRFRRMLHRHYGPDADPLLQGGGRG